ncbi:MAG: DUF3604 domain-containing protein [Verrucomicrobia bacterium]|nr:DUF3604 domain-containing protein [Verrucomicrobiota bacterium]
MRRLQLPDPVCLNDGRGSDKYPCAIVDRHNRLWLAWQRFADGRDTTVVTCLRDNFVVYREELGATGYAYKPVLCEDAAGRIAVAWSEVGEGGSAVCLSWIAHGQHSPPGYVSMGGRDLEPSLAADAQGRLWVAYHSFRSGRASVFLRVFQDGWSDEIEVTPGMEAYRPSVVTLGGGRVRVFFDAFAGGRYDVYSVDCDGRGVGAPQRWSTGGTWCNSASAVRDGRGGAAVAWTGIGSGAYVCHDVAVDGRVERVASLETRYASHAIAADRDSVWLAWRGPKSVMLARRLDRTTGTWSAAVAVDRSGLYTRRPAVALNRSGVLWVAWQGSPANGKHPVRDARVFLQALPPDVAHAPADPMLPPHAWPSEAGHEIPLPFDESTPYKTSDGRRVFFGDIHGQISFSDGLGTHDQFYNFERHVSRLDLGAVTDHCDYPDGVAPSEWNVTRLLASAFNEPGQFVTLLGYEWTSNEVRDDFGHKNVYFPGDRGEVFSPLRESGRTPEALHAGAKRYGALVVPHHVSANWGSVSAATDWSRHDPETERLCEIASIHGAMEYDGNPRAHSQPPVPNCSVQAALARGCRLGLIASSDTHQLAPGRDGGIVAVVCDELSREAVFEALRSRRCYASTGPRLLIEFSVNGHGMGNEAPAAGDVPVVVAYRVEADRPIVAVQIVRDNANVHREDPVGSSCSGEWRDPASRSPGVFYYLRVELEDNAFAWSSPVWIV